MLGKAGLELALQVDEYRPKIAVLGPEVLEICHQLDKESKVEALIWFILADIKRGFVTLL